MKMQLLISKMIFCTLFFCISCTKDSCRKNLDVKGYKVLSVMFFKQHIDIGNYDVINLLMKSKPINGIYKGIVLTELQIYNPQKKDTVYITIYGRDFKVFRIENCFYESKVPIIKPFDTDSVWHVLGIKY